MVSEHGERRRRRILALLFFASGAAGLVDQVAWLRYLALVFGNTTLATATLLAVFMAGLGLGAVLFGRLSDRTAPVFGFGPPPPDGRDGRGPPPPEGVEA